MTLINTHSTEHPCWGVELNGVNRKNEFEIMKGTLHYSFSTRGPIGCTGSVGVKRMDIFDGEWHHIVYTNDSIINKGGRSGSHKIIIYIDGVSTTISRGGFAGTSKREFLPFTAPVHLGARKFPGKAHGYFTGTIDEVRFYDHPLTAEEVIQNFESTEPYDVAPKGKLPTVWATLKTKL